MINSEKILKTYNMSTEAILAGSHHKSSHHEYKIAIGNTGNKNLLPED